MKQQFESLVKCLALDTASRDVYLKPSPREPVQVRDPQVEVLTRKPLLIIALLVRGRPYANEWWDSLTSEQKMACEQLHALIAIILELGVWVLFSDEPNEQEMAKEYYPVWEICRALASNCIVKLGWTPGPPESSFEFLLEHFTIPIQEWSETMVR